MTLASNVTALATRVAIEFNSVRANFVKKKAGASEAIVQITDPTNEHFLRWNIVDDSSNTTGWPDRMAFLFNGVRTGSFNEYGEIRVEAAKTNTIAMRAHGFLSGGVAASTVDIFQVREARGIGDVLLGVARAGITARRAIEMNSNKITGLGTPTVGTDAATKTYVDNTIGSSINVTTAALATAVSSSSLVPRVFYYNTTINRSLITTSTNTYIYLGVLRLNVGEEIPAGYIGAIIRIPV